MSGWGGGGIRAYNHVEIRRQGCREFANIRKIGWVVASARRPLLSTGLLYTVSCYVPGSGRNDFRWKKLQIFSYYRGVSQSNDSGDF